jgi:hypothetical protein
MGKGFELTWQTPGCSRLDFNFLFLFVVVLIRCKILPPFANSAGIEVTGIGQRIKATANGEKDFELVGKWLNTSENTFANGVLARSPVARGLSRC